MRVIMTFYSLITNICLVSRVSIIVEDEHIKNEGALTTWTIYKFAGESAAATLEHAVVTWAMKVIGVKRRLQELSDSIT